MITKIEYQTEEERELIISESELVLIEEQTLLDGKFLIFSDEPRPLETVYDNVALREIESLKQVIADLTEIVLGGV